MASQTTLRQKMRVKARLPTFAEGPSDELKDGLGKFHEPKLASLGAAAHGGRGKVGSAVSTRKGKHPPCVALALGARLSKPREADVPQKLREQHSCLCSESGFCIQKACRARCLLPPSLPPPPPAVHSSPHHGRTSGRRGWDGDVLPGHRALRGTRGGVRLSRAGREELAFSQALLTVFLTWQW